jgi:mRNA deadenylase 3'-5' endonuclease subunit Ccr4
MEKVLSSMSQKSKDNEGKISFNLMTYNTICQNITSKSM